MHRGIMVTKISLQETRPAWSTITSLQRKTENSHRVWMLKVRD